MLIPQKRNFSSVRHTYRRFYGWKDTNSEVPTDEKEKEQIEEQRAHGAKLTTVEAGMDTWYSLCSFVCLIATLLKNQAAPQNKAFFLVVRKTKA